VVRQNVVVGQNVVVRQNVAENWQKLQKLLIITSTPGFRSRWRLQNRKWLSAASTMDEQQPVNRDDRVGSMLYIGICITAIFDDFDQFSEKLLAILLKTNDMIVLWGIFAVL
jgi:hypothetical protein